MKFKKGSAAAKAFMAKLRAAKGNLQPKLKVSAKLKSHTLGAVKKSPAKSYHKDTKSHNVNVRVVSGLDKVTRRGKKTSVHYSRMSGIHKMIASVQKEYIALYDLKHDFESAIFNAKNLKEAKSYANMYKRHNPKLSKAKTSVRLYKETN